MLRALRWKFLRRFCRSKLIKVEGIVNFNVYPRFIHEIQSLKSYEMKKEKTQNIICNGVCNC